MLRFSVTQPISKHYLSMVCVLGFLLTSFQTSELLAKQTTPVDIRVPKDEKVSVMIAEALTAESDGDLERREKLLANAANRFGSPAAKWQLGKIQRRKNSWPTIGEEIEAAQSNSKQIKYERLRDESSDTFQGHQQMANWCLKNRLPMQRRAHLEKALDFQPDNRSVRRELGYRWEAGNWVSPSQLAARKEVRRRKKNSIKRYGSKIKKIATRLKSRNAEKREQGKNQLMEIRDPTALAAVEDILKSPSVEISNLVLRWMDQLNEVDSSLVLARYGLFHPDRKVQRNAIKRLQKRPLHDFVPGLMGMLSTQIQAEVRPSSSRIGGFNGYQQSFTREGFEQKEFLSIDHEFNPVLVNRTASPLRSSRSDPRSLVRRPINWPVNNAQTDELRERADDAIEARMDAMKKQNEEIKRTNRRVASMMTAVVGQRFGDDPREMWDWWDRYNETEYEASKPERYRRESYNEYVPVEVPARRRSSECFVEGTLVTTRTGFKEIQNIKVGDLVLSKNVSTGRLDWKPVLDATRRDPSETRDLKFGIENFRCTNGHLFWVSGRGWRRASQLMPGDVLHGAERPTRVVANYQGVPMPTYNLEVADFNNYFVGQQRILSHDVTRRRANRQAVPGAQSKRNRSSESQQR